MNEELIITLIVAGLLAAAVFGKARGRTPGLPRPAKRDLAGDRRASADRTAPRRAHAPPPAAPPAAALRRAAGAPHGDAVTTLLRALLDESRASGLPPGGARVVDHPGGHQGYALGDWAENAPYLHVFVGEPVDGVAADLMLSYGVKGQVFGYAAVIVETRRDRQGRPADRTTAVVSTREAALRDAGYATLAFDPAEIAANAADCARACLTPVHGLIGAAA